MKYFMIAAAIASLAMTGCTPKLANRELGPEEKAWKEYLEPMYPGWKVPATLPPAVAERTAAETDSFDDGFSLPEPAKESDKGKNDSDIAEQNSDADSSLTANEDEKSNAVRYEDYIVVKDDSLSIIAKKVYGNGRKYHRILKANEDVIKDPNRIYPGMKLRIPRP